MSISTIVKSCPVEVSLEILGKKWAVHIIRDLFRGVVRYSDFLTLNPKLTTKMLSKRLKDLIEYGLVERVLYNTTPVTVEYHLSEKGIALNSLIIELSNFSINQFPSKVFRKLDVSAEEYTRATTEVLKRFSVISSTEDYKPESPVDTSSIS